ncbi:GNAT family N-acetyltransferase [Halomarina oriensis]|uniref:GNAT family N-acetyltransferase n=1 Tax=Halomarina oriensis TaxID=671145 RepID=A0A6B0GJE0_9EURY|nr:GNAT family N-acetyltransferase [Halomarina oriensis]MWG34952.1 GNAT family N-acetyltransferase [Halomarina oriensis]
MSPDRIYPDDVADEFERPPISFADREDRPVTVRDHEATDEGFESLVEMYVAFDPEDRAQGIPPTGEQQVRDWLEHILTGDCVNVVAVLDDGRRIGHATLVPDVPASQRDSGASENASRSGDGEVAYELAIFVLAAYQGAGIGTSLIRGLLGAGQEQGVEQVWLTVERWNHPAVALYKKVGFETSKTESFELEMSLRLN